MAVAAKGLSLWGGAVGDSSPSFNNAEQAKFCKERKAATLNEATLAKGYPNRLDRKYHSFTPTWDNTSCQLSGFEQLLDEPNIVKNIGKGGRLMEKIDDIGGKIKESLD